MSASKENNAGDGLNRASVSFAASPRRTGIHSSGKKSRRSSDVGCLNTVSFGGPCAPVAEDAPLEDDDNESGFQAFSGDASAKLDRDRIKSQARILTAAEKRRQTVGGAGARPSLGGPGKRALKTGRARRASLSRPGGENGDATAELAVLRVNLRELQDDNARLKASDAHRQTRLNKMTITQASAEQELRKWQGKFHEKEKERSALAVANNKLSRDLAQSRAREAVLQEKLEAQERIIVEKLGGNSGLVPPRGHRLGRAGPQPLRLKTSAGARRRAANAGGRSSAGGSAQTRSLASGSVHSFETTSQMGVVLEDGPDSEAAFENSPFTDAQTMFRRTSRCDNMMMMSASSVDGEARRFTLGPEELARMNRARRLTNGSGGRTERNCLRVDGLELDTSAAQLSARMDMQAGSMQPLKLFTLQASCGTRSVGYAVMDSQNTAERARGYLSKTKGLAVTLVKLDEVPATASAGQ